MTNSRPLNTTLVYGGSIWSDEARRGGRAATYFNDFVDGIIFDKGQAPIH
ncbi:hypothetical protein PcaKH15_35390 [Parageobacillus caldoxylosilyticus]|nr:hypothetical protein PcaKH15_35390 [Parageobacillus caldoxylosilyticus]BDG41425.1 hypothetical protein PcaKH16_35640 [Parageobacillus caldoxylosilyticus]